MCIRDRTLDRVKSDLEGFCICGENDSRLFTDNSLIQPAIIVLKKNVRVLKDVYKRQLVWGAYMGLPLSLEGIGKVLKLENQKMAEGKALIRYFCVPCKPTKANGGRMRNLPEHDPVKLSTFIAYNKRDVESEMAIQQKLSKFPVPDFLRCL